MKINALFGSIALGFLPSSIASPPPEGNYAVSHVVRGLPDAPDGYAPVNVTCPANRPTIRIASILSPNETAWLNVRRTQTVSALKTFLARVGIDNFNASSYIETYSNDISNLPNIAFAISGGGLPAIMNGAGLLKATDSRTDGALAEGQLGGLLQSATYVSALSGGSWVLSSVFMNNFTTVQALQADIWDFSYRNILMGPVKWNNTVEFWGNVTAQVKSKKDAGFLTSSTDFWGRVQGYNFLDASDGGVDYLWSSIAQTQGFQAGDYPLPLVVADSEFASNSAINLSALSLPQYEVTPWEFDTYDESIYGFTPLEYLGSEFVNGEVPENGTCVNGFDNAGFITGTSSDVWNENSVDIGAQLEEGISAYGNSSEGQLLSWMLKEYLSAVTSSNSTVNGPAHYGPNPFYHYNTASSPYAHDTALTVIDGGENGQNIPLNPLIQRKRNWMSSLPLIPPTTAWAQTIPTAQP